MAAVHIYISYSRSAKVALSKGSQTVIESAHIYTTGGPNEQIAALASRAERLSGYRDPANLRCRFGEDPMGPVRTIHASFCRRKR
jgi:hypothetical protein